MRSIGAWTFVIVLAGAGGWVAAQQNPTITGDQSLVPQCAVASSATYAVTKEDPVKVGGGAMTVSARERRYLDALRGPAGQTIRFKRNGSLPGPDKTILDLYEITYDGLEKPVSLYIDAYRWSTPKAPQGFVCGAAIGLNPPPPDPFLVSANLVEMAIEFGATGELPPMPLDPGGQGTHGVVFDRFRRIAQAAKVAATSGKPLDPQDPPSGFSALPTIVVAYPLTCDGRTIAPEEVDVVNAQGRSAPKSGQYSRGDDLAKLIGGVTVPAGALGVAFSIPTIRTNEVVRITYRDVPCGSSEKTVSLPVAVTLARRLQAVPPVLPPRAPGTPGPSAPLRLQVYIGPDGAVRFPAYLDGPDELTDLAMAAVRDWRYEPMRSNGAVVVVPINITVPFIDNRGRSGGPVAQPMMGMPTGSGGTIELPGGARFLTSPAEIRALDAPLVKLAIGAPATQEVTGISLDADGSRTHGVGFDRFRVGVLLARAAAADGRPLNADAPPDNFPPRGVIVVAFPKTCGGQSISPQSLTMLDSRQQPVPQAEQRDAAGLREVLPGVTLPAAAIGVIFNRGIFLNGDVVRIAYGAACPGSSSEVALPISVSLPSPQRQVHPETAPGGINGAVRVSAMVDADGSVKFATAVDGPAALQPEGARVAGDWRWTPSRINGSPVPTTIGFTVRFGPSGGRAGPGGPGGSLPNPDAAMATATFRTNDASGLTPATSQCEVSTEPSYGLTAASPVKVGGGATLGVPAARQYLMALRGPEGQGLQFRRSSIPTASTPGAEAYDVFHSGLTRPVQVFIDTNTKADLKAPAGFLCVVPVR